MRYFLFILIALGLNTISFGKNKTWTCINENGETIFRTEAITVSDFKNGLARIYKYTLVNNKWVGGNGYVNRKGEIVIPCIYKEAKDFESEVTWVKLSPEAPYELIDKTGNIIVTTTYDKVQNFSENQPNLCAVYKGDKMGFVNTKGEEVIPCIYRGSFVFSNGLASVSLASSVKNAYGYINKKGEEVIPFKSGQEGTSAFMNGVARAQADGQTVLIDTTGKVIFKTAKGNIQGQNFNRVLVITKPNRRGWGWLNFEDEFVIKPDYDHATNFNEDGYAIVEKKGLKGVIDTTGNIVIPVQYQSVYADITQDGYFAGQYPSKNGTPMANAKKDYYDRNFNLLELTDVQYLMSARGGNRILYKTFGGRIGYYDRNFNLIIPPQYSRAYSFSEGLAWVLD